VEQEATPAPAVEEAPETESAPEAPAEQGESHEQTTEASAS
jgi:hypothetical protein